MVSMMKIMKKLDLKIFKITNKINNIINKYNQDLNI